MTVSKTIRAIQSPRDDIKVTMTSMFAAVPSASLSITRHGVAEHAFSLDELANIAEAITDFNFMLKHKEAA